MCSFISGFYFGRGGIVIDLELNILEGLKKTLQILKTHEIIL